jgi:glycosyltransferase involved in cell wall biosynthesis
MYPWNGNLWAQVNINTQQSEALHKDFGFSNNKLYELSTTVSDEFFQQYSKEDVRITRLTMAHILSNGSKIIQPVDINSHIFNLPDWMHQQKPIVCATKDGITLDLTDENLLYCLQPTRIIARKRIEKDLQLFAALFEYPEFKNEFVQNKNRKIILHITGPVPIEHQKDTEIVLQAYKNMVNNLPDNLAERVFIAFSVGNEDHSSLNKAGLKRLHIEDIYRLANIILFPSETEGRGLPIVESGACGIPIVCSRYYPEEVFSEVVGEHLSEDKQIQYILFPEDDFSDNMLKTVTSVLLNPEDPKILAMIKHNKNAVYERYGMGGLIHTFEEVINSFGNPNGL